MKEKAQHLIELRSTHLLKWPLLSLHFLGKKEQQQQKITLVLYFTYILHSSHVRAPKSPIYHKLLWPAPCGVSTTPKKAPLKATFVVICCYWNRVNSLENSLLEITMESKLDYLIPRDIAPRRPYTLHIIPFQARRNFACLAWLAFVIQQ